MFEQTVNELKSLNYIEQNDIVVACMRGISMKSLILVLIPAAIGGALAGILGGMIAGMIVLTIVYSMATRHILAVNENGLRIFNVNKRTKDYLGTYSEFRKDEITEASVKGSRGSFNIILRTTSGNRPYMTKNKFEKYLQVEEIERLKVFFGSAFNKTL